MARLSIRPAGFGVVLSRPGEAAYPAFEPLQPGAALGRDAAGVNDMTFPLEFQRALRRAKLLYLTTFGANGKSGTVPVLFLFDEGAVYFCSQRETLKVRRIRQTGWVTVRAGRPDGPALSCGAQLLDEAPELQARLLRTYRRRYWLRWLVLGPRLRKAFADGTEVLVRLVPDG